MTVPVIDIEPLCRPADPAAVAAAGAEIDAACREVGFFSIVGHGVDADLCARLDALAREFFAQPDADKAEIAMARAGKAWRGWFPLGGELTAGVADQKEGLYFGAELGEHDPRVRAGLALHGANLFPRAMPELRSVVLTYLDELTRVGQAVLRGVALGLALEPTWFAEHLTADPTILFRIFPYPPTAVTDGTGEGEGAGGGEGAMGWGVAEHTDYGLLTILGQDDAGGLQVRARDGWTHIDPVPCAFVCNLGDMLERLTGGRYRSTPHRVRNTSGRDRLSFPFFFDPSWDATVRRVPIIDRPTPEGGADDAERWDHLSVHGYVGTYGDYLLGKVGRVFPALADNTNTN